MGSQGSLESFGVRPKATETDKTISSTSLEVQLGDGKWDKDVIKLSNWNVNGIRACQGKGELDNYFNTYKPDALILNETKIDITAFKTDKPGDKIPEEYYQYWNFCKIKKSNN